MLKVRFAPSPTGFLHIGGARTALFNWLYARKKKGQFILRIEDTDQSRTKSEYLNEILESLRWLRLDWDEIFYQSRRFDIYRDYAQKLIQKGRAYRKDGAVFFKYDFNRIEINDLIRGKIIFSELPKPEEVIIKKDGSPAYNFSCCLDDALMGINCVIRGEDHLSNTPKQILIYQALGFKLPDFAHIPLTLSPEGGRLSKRFGATAISDYRKEGYLPEALANYFLLLGWSPGKDREIISLEEAEKLLEIKNINKTGSAFSLDKLRWINAQYIKLKNTNQLSQELKEYLSRINHSYAGLGQEELKKGVNLFKTRLSTLFEFPEKVSFLFDDIKNYCPEAEEVLKPAKIKEVKELKKALTGLEDFRQTDIERVFRETLSSLGLKLKDLVHPVRVALTGRRKGPGLFETMEALGKNKVTGRLDKLIEYWES